MTDRFDSPDEAAADIDWRLPPSRRQLLPPARPPRTDRERLDREMQAVLTQLATCSHVPAAGWGPTGRSRSSDEPPGGSRPPGDIGHVQFAREYGPPFHPRTKEHPGSRTERARADVLERARSELKHLRGHDQRAQPTGETLVDRNARIVKEGEGFTVKEVALRFRCGERDVRRAREADEREPDFGREPTPERDAAARQTRVRELKDKGLTIAQIMRLLDVSRSTVERDLGRRAA